jgi:DNA polymerase III delta prime subunit
MNEDAADALLKDLEEPPPYAVMVLVASDLGPIPETIRSRCQLVPFRRLSERAVRDEIEGRAPGLEPEEMTALARVAGGRLDRVDRLLDPAAAKRRDALLTLARDVYRDPTFEPGDAAKGILAAAAERGADAREAAEGELERLDLTQREADQRLRRAQRGAEREELPRLARGARRLVSRPRRRRDGRRARRDPLRPARRAERGRDPRPAGGRRTCL